MKEIVKDFYDNYYSKIFNAVGGGGFSSIAYRLTHKKLETKHNVDQYFEKVLEIGAGQGEHLKFIRHKFLKYIMSDLMPIKIQSTNSNVECMSFDASSIPFEDKFFDRCLMMCVLHHVQDTEKVLKEIKRVTKTRMEGGGVISIFLPHDPLLAIRLNRRFFVTPRVKKLGFPDYELFNALEHRNHYHSILIQIMYIFSDAKIKVRQYPFHLRVPSINLFSIIEIYL